MNKLLALIFLLPAAALALPHERTCNGTSQADVNACINGGSDGVQTWSPAVDGEIIHLKATPSVTWTSPIVVDRNVQIYGAGTGASGTNINGGNVWQLKPHGGTLQPRMILSGMHLNQDRAGQLLNVTGVCPIIDAHSTDPTQSGGFDVDHILFTVTNSSFGGYMIVVGGWPEGCIHHNVVDCPFGGQLGGEWVIINFNGTPTTATGSGFWAWTHPPPINSNHLITFEDNIFHRHGAFDSNQFSTGLAGGSMYRARHNTVWHGISGHGGPADSHVWGIRFEDAHKNLFVRGIDEGAAVQSLNMIDVRGGEALVWGNRMNRYGVSNQTAANAFQIECNGVSSNLQGDMTGGPDGTNPWFLNQKGNFTIGSINYAPENGYIRTYTNTWTGPSKISNGVETIDDGSNGGAGSTSPAGDVYLSGTGGTMLSVHTFTLKKNGVVLSAQPAHKWENFMVVNLSKQPGVSSGPANPFGNPNGTDTSPSSQTYAYVISHAEVGGQTVFTMLTTNMYDAKPPEWAISATDQWEMRRVKEFLNVAGHGSGDSLVDESTAGVAPQNLNGLRLQIGSPNPRWINEPTNLGVHKWDDQYRLSATGTWTDVADWGNLAVICQYACGSFVGSGSAVPIAAGYTYDGTTPIGSATGGTGGASHTELRPETRVGADAVAWALVPAGGYIDTTDSGCPNSPCEGVQSFYTLGSGGPPYPHPFVTSAPAVGASGPSFKIGGTDHCATDLTNTNCAHITATGFTTSPIVITIDSWSPALSNVSLADNGDGTATIHGTASSNTAQAYATTVHADTASEHATTAFSLTVQSGNQPPSVSLTSPNATTGLIFGPTDTVSLVADAQDDVGVTKVEFYDGATCLNCPDGDTTTPYSYSTTFSVTGTHSLTAKAYDGTLSTASSAVNITITNPLSTPTPPAIIQLKP